jgi:hypothetical protein
MRTAGFALLLLGASSFAFKMLNPPRQSLIMSVFGPYEQHAAIGCLAAGALLFALSFRKKKDVKQ